MFQARLGFLPSKLEGRLRGDPVRLLHWCGPCPFAKRAARMRVGAFQSGCSYLLNGSAPSAPRRQKAGAGSAIASPNPLAVRRFPWALKVAWRKGSHADALCRVAPARSPPTWTAAKIVNFTTRNAQKTARAVSIRKRGSRQAVTTTNRANLLMGMAAAQPRASVNSDPHNTTTPVTPRTGRRGR